MNTSHGSRRASASRIAAVFASASVALSLAACANPLYLPGAASDARLAGALTRTYDITVSTLSSRGQSINGAFAIPGRSVTPASGLMLFFPSSGQIAPYALTPGSPSTSGSYAATQLSGISLQYYNATANPDILTPLYLSSPTAGVEYFGLVIFGNADPTFDTIEVDYTGGGTSGVPTSQTLNQENILTDITTYASGLPTLDRVVSAAVTASSTGQSLYVLVRDTTPNYYTVEIPIDPTTGLLMPASTTVLGNTSLTLTFAGSPANGFYQYDASASRHFFSWFNGTKFVTARWKDGDADPASPGSERVAEITADTPVRAFLSNGDFYGEYGATGEVFNATGGVQARISLGSFRFAGLSSDAKGNELVLFSEFFEAHYPTETVAHVRLYATTDTGLIAAGI